MYEYKLDGLHLGRTGTDFLGGVFAWAVGEGLNKYAREMGTDVKS